jgi:DNA helicase-2/ATP-dependent DNA helicase PcrA
MRFLEQCAMWCCGGWTTGTPRLSRVIGEGARIFHEVLDDDDDRLVFQREVTAALWERRDAALGLHDWLVDLRDAIIAPRVAVSRSLDDDLATLNTFVDRLGPTGDVDDMLLGEFAGIGTGLARLNLSSLHSAKGREFDVVVLFGAEEGRIPRSGAGANEVREARRLFYVGFTRARHEVHLMYGKHIPSRFVTEVRDRIEATGT